MAIGSNIGSQLNSHTAHSLSISEQSWSHLQFSHQNMKNIFIYDASDDTTSQIKRFQLIIISATISLLLFMPS